MNRYDPKPRSGKQPLTEELTLVDDSAEGLLHPGATGGKTAPAFNPYNREVPVLKGAASAKANASTRTDLRKLSEWIKLKRDVEQLKGTDVKDTED